MEAAVFRQPGEINYDAKAKRYSYTMNTIKTDKYGKEFTKS